MPVYAYKCKDCNHQFDLRQSFSDPAVKVCPECGGEVRKEFNSVGVVFKGSGFYRNDSRESGKNTASTSGNKDSASTANTASGSGSSESASAPASGKATPSGDSAAGAAAGSAGKTGGSAGASGRTSAGAAGS